MLWSDVADLIDDEGAKPIVDVWATGKKEIFFSLFCSYISIKIALYYLQLTQSGGTGKSVSEALNLVEQHCLFVLPLIRIESVSRQIGFYPVSIH